MTIPQPVKPIYLALAALVLGIVADIFFMTKDWGIVVPIFTVIFFAMVAVLDRQAEKRMRPFDVAVMVSVLIISIFFAIRDSEMLFVLNMLVMLYLTCLMLVSLYGANIKGFRPWDFFIFPTFDFYAALMTSAGIFKHLKPSGSGKSRVFGALLVAAILLVIFGALFAGADQVFQTIVHDALNGIDGFDDLAVVLFVGVIALLAFAPAFWRRATIREVKPIQSTKDVGVESVIVLGLIDVLFFLFIIVQSVYLFSGQANLEAFHTTFAEYARQGFFQLLTVAILVSVIVWTLRYLTFGAWSLVVKTLQVVLILLTGGVLVSSWMRLSLYEQQFGFTHDRLFSHSFLLVVAAVVVVGLIWLGANGKY